MGTGERNDYLLSDALQAIRRQNLGKQKKQCYEGEQKVIKTLTKMMKIKNDNCDEINDNDKVMIMTIIVMMNGKTLPC